VAADKPPLLRVWCTPGALCVRVPGVERPIAQPNRVILHTGAVQAQLTIVANHLLSPPCVAVGVQRTGTALVLHLVRYRGGVYD
jgi:hypothetical protein